MPEYRRRHTRGAAYALTLALQDRRKRALVERVDALRETLQAVRLRMPFTIVAMVVLREHLHAVWRLPPGDSDYASRIRIWKTAFSAGMPARPATASQARRGERGVWQRRFWEHQIRDEEDLRAHVGYIHWNPVKHGLVRAPDDWPHSSIHRFRHRGSPVLPPPEDFKMDEPWD